MRVMMIGASPEGKEVMQAPWEFVTAVGVDSLKQPKDNPDVHREDVKVFRESTPQDRRANSP